ncbi:MIP/aquaporin family protein [Streptomyces sp. NPDC050564]|uniref:MIP/aquaporin family protein n=1 Tax=Streptomyces sp. NPDC050564 TaxID=3365631 RepID=UPI0037B67920
MLPEETTGMSDSSAACPNRRPLYGLPDAAREFVLTSVLLYCVVTAARWLTSPDSPVAVDNARAATATVGVVVGIVLVVLITSPPGRNSGAHMNPAISVALWLMGAFPGRYVPAYAAAQLAGSVAGTSLGRLCWGSVVSRSSMRYAAVHPNPAWNTAALVLAEGGCLVLVVLMVGFFLAHPAVSRWLPYAVGVATALIITVLGGLSGGSANPARQLGPALLSGGTPLLWVYLVAPLIGASLGAAAHCLFQRRLGARTPCTYRLCGSDDALRNRVR